MGDELGDINIWSRIQIEDIRNDEWFIRGYVPVELIEYEDVNLDDINAVFDDPEEEPVDEPCRNKDVRPLALNAFDLIILSQGLNHSALFDRRQDYTQHQTRFVSQKPAKVMRVEGLSANKTLHFSVILEVFQVAPTFFMVDIQKALGDASEYLKFYKNFCEKSQGYHREAA
ncbi:hypothetical protein HYC85_023945 [Camellia sinensis]|uniref:NAF domain-containing protein n=1 Tax=Camellia sinensis TaxID=4442 RepID=A0A7J7GJT1_CAMSI|nr:hypothetical protein HYC85_023945 [Camellia sinensis]